jgi:hypothetical protein
MHNSGSSSSTITTSRNNSSSNSNSSTEQQHARQKHAVQFTKHTPGVCSTEASYGNTQQLCRLQLLPLLLLLLLLQQQSRITVWADMCVCCMLCRTSSVSVTVQHHHRQQQTAASLTGPNLRKLLSLTTLGQKPTSPSHMHTSSKMALVHRRCVC